MIPSHLADMGLPMPFCSITGAPLPRVAEKRTNSFLSCNLTFQREAGQDHQGEGSKRCCYLLYRTGHQHSALQKLIYQVQILQKPPFQAFWTLANFLLNPFVFPIIKLRDHSIEKLKEKKVQHPNKICYNILVYSLSDFYFCIFFL